MTALDIKVFVTVATAAAPRTSAAGHPVTRESMLSMSDLLRTTVEIQSNLAVNVAVYVSGNDPVKATESAKVDVRVEGRAVQDGRSDAHQMEQNDISRGETHASLVGHADSDSGECDLMAGGEDSSSSLLAAIPGDVGAEGMGSQIGQYGGIRDWNRTQDDVFGAGVWASTTGDGDSEDMTPSMLLDHFAELDGEGIFGEPGEQSAEQNDLVVQETHWDSLTLLDNEGSSCM